MHSSFRPSARKCASAFACVLAILVAGCGSHNYTSGYGIGWVTLTDEPGDFASYIVTVDAVTLTGKTVGLISAVAIPEIVDFSKLGNIAELWASASIPNDTYLSAAITLDYSAANVSVLVNGVPVKANLVDPTGAQLGQVTINVTFDPANPPVIVPTYASTNAIRLAIDFNLAASNTVDLSTATPTVTVNPFITMSTAASDNKLIRIRGPLVNSSAGPNGVQTYTVYVRPFFDEVNSIGSVSIFNDANTVYTINGVPVTGAAGLTQLSQSSAGTTMTAAYTTFEPTAAQFTYAGKFHSVYVVAGSTLEDFYTDGLEGDVIARAGDVLTLRGSTLAATAAEVTQFNDGDANVTLGPSTIVTADGVPLAGLNSGSIAVGQHIVARGIYSQNAAGAVQLDATGNSSTNTGSVRLQQTSLYGTLNAAASGSLAMNLQSIGIYPVSVYNFAGNGASAAQDSNPANYIVNSGTLTLPDGSAAGTPLYIDGLMNTFGAAPPDFNAYTISAEAATPATMQVDWTAPGATSPFASISGTGFTVDLANAAYSSGSIRISGDVIDLKTLPATPNVVAATPTAPVAGASSVFLPEFAFGSPTNITVLNGFAAFQAQAPAAFATAAATRLVARGVYSRATNTFTASSIHVVN